MPESSTAARRLVEFARLFKAGEYESALALIDTLAAENPNEGPILWQRARTLEKLGRYAEALAAVRRVVDLRRELAQTFVSDSPEELAAVSIAWQILQMAQEPSPDYVPATPSGYPSHQRAHEHKSTKQLARLGFTKLGDFDPLHLAVTLARKQMLSLHVRDDGAVCAAAFSIKPRWPGLRGWLAMLFKGEWRAADVVELETGFSDGTFVSTNNAGTLGALGHGPYRRSIGYVSDEELRRLMGEQYDQLGPKVREKLRLMTPEEIESVTG